MLIFIYIFFNNTTQSLLKNLDIYKFFLQNYDLFDNNENVKPKFFIKKLDKAIKKYFKK